MLKLHLICLLNMVTWRYGANNIAMQASSECKHYVYTVYSLNS